MKNSSTLTDMTQALAAPRLRGYQIRIYHGRPFATLTGTIWASDIPAEWEAAKVDQTTSKAVLYRSGRTFRTYQKEA